MWLSYFELNARTLGEEHHVGRGLERRLQGDVAAIELMVGLDDP